MPTPALLPLAQQEATLRSLGTRRTRDITAAVMALLALACGWATWRYAHNGWLLGCFFFCFIAWVALNAAPHFMRATAALDSGTRVQGRVELSPIDDSDRYTAVVSDNSDGGARWAFSCSTSGWKPEADQTYPAEVCYLPGVRWPVLVRVTLTDGGCLLYPNSAPKPLTRQVKR